MSAAQPLLQDAPSPADAHASPEEAAQKQDQAAALATKAREFTDAVVFGVINGIVGIPTMISFATIIYKVLTVACDASLSLPSLPCRLTTAQSEAAGCTAAGPGIQPVPGRSSEAGLLRERRAPGSLHSHVDAAVRGRTSAGKPSHLAHLRAPSPCTPDVAECCVNSPR